MRLITELQEQVQYVTEADASGKRKCFIEGVFLQAGIPNKNKRIYPEQVMENEVNRYIKESVSKHKAWGELGHPCFGDTAELLTQSGWKQIKDAVVGELVYTLNSETRNIELHPIKEVNINHYKGPMINISNRGFNTTVTPNHNFLIYYRNGKPYQISAAEIKENIDNNVSILAKFSIPKTGKIINEAEQKIIINGLEFDTKTFVSFLSLYLAEGCTTKRKNRNNSYKIQIFQNDGEKAKKIDELLSKIPLKWNKYLNEGKITWTSHNIKLAEYLYKLGNSYEKYIPEEIINVLDADLAENVLEWYILGDGRGNIEKGNHQKSDVFSTSPKMIHDLSIVAVKAGYAFHNYTQSEFEDVIIENRIIKAENKKPLHFLQLLKTENIYLDKRHIKINEIQWDADVYCISVQNGVFLAKDNGYCFWSGNSGPTINLDKASHLIKSLVKEGKNYIGKAEILETTNGNIVKALLEAGGNLGVSSRGLGSLRPIANGLNEVMDDFRLSTAADIVADPSAPDAFVNGIMENVEFYYDGSELRAKTIEEIQKTIRSTSKRNLQEAKLNAFTKFMRIISET